MVMTTYDLHSPDGQHEKSGTIRTEASFETVREARDSVKADSGEIYHLVQFLNKRGFETEAVDTKKIFF
jgi:hypothetical protein